MPSLIKDGAVASDNWRVLEKPEEGQAAAVAVPDQRVIVPLAVWQAQREPLQARRQTLGVWLGPEDSADQLGAEAGEFELLAVHFPTFMDGRGFSTARLLRERYAFNGELRAIGHFIRDQLCYMRRCGFNAFSFAEPIDLQAALASLDDFTEYYQAGTDQPLPLFRRRA